MSNAMINPLVYYYMNARYQEKLRNYVAASSDHRNNT